MNKKCLILTAALCLALAGCSSDSSSDAASSSKNSSSSSSSVSSSSAGDNDSSRTNESTSSEASTESDSSSQAVPFGQIKDDMIPDISNKREDISIVWGKNANSYRTVDVDYHTMSQQLGLSLADNEKRRLTLKSLDFPFYFDGIAIGNTDKVQKEENNSIVTYTTAKEGAVAFVELGEATEVKNNFAGYTDYPVYAIAFDIDYITEDENFTFLREYIDIGEYTESFELGDKKEKVEDLLGKGYEQNGYAFYRGASRDKKKVYFIVHYTDDNTVKQVFIIGRELYETKGTV